MLDILKKIVESGITEQWPGDGSDLLHLVKAFSYFRKKALWAGVRSLEEVDDWHKASVELLIEYVPQDLLLNTAAELYENAFKHDNCSRLLVILGSVLGEAAWKVPQYFAHANRFVTRVVGLRYGERQNEAERLKPGTPVQLIREPGNHHDPNAMAVVAPWGALLGYIRAPLAAVLSPRCSSGEVFHGCVVCFLGPEFDPNERLYIEVWSELGKGEPEHVLWEISIYREEIIS